MIPVGDRALRRRWGRRRLDTLGNWQEFSQDADGNGSGVAAGQERTHDEANELTGITGNLNWVDPLHDDAGNMILAPRPGQESCACEALLLVYDGWNRLATAYEDTNGDGDLDVGMDALIAAYAYDGLGRRIEKTIGETATHYFLNEDWQVLETRVGTDPDPLDQYVWDVRYAKAPVVRFHDGNTDGDYDGGTLEGDNTLYYTQDANFNTTALIDPATGEAVERTSFAAYGQTTFYGGDWSNPRSDSVYASEILYAGYRLDPETGMYQVRFRYYHPTLGGWTSRDIPYIDGTNLYAYSRGDPANITDPMGLYPGKWPVDQHSPLLAESFNQGWPKTPENSSARSAILSALSKANLEQDEGGFFKDQSRHYNRELDEDPDLADMQYGQTLEVYGMMFHEYLAIVDPHPWDKNDVDNCKEALNCLGAMTHMWQDYFAHAVLKDSGKFGPAWTADDPIKGDPYNRNRKLKPSSYLTEAYKERNRNWEKGPVAEHPWKTNPESLDTTKEYDVTTGTLKVWDPRRDHARSFVATELGALLDEWWSKCYCLYSK